MKQGKHLIILQMNDSHAYLEPHVEFYWHGDKEIYRLAGGYARIAALFNKIRRENPGQVVALDNGDTIHGTYPAVASKGEALVPVLNRLAFDAMTAHWEFAYGPEQLQNIVRQLNYPILALNCYDRNTNKLAFPPYKIIEREGIRIGIIGIAATIVDKTMPEHFSKGLYFTLGKDELPVYISHLREQEKVGLIIVISHLGYPQDFKLAGEVRGTDILLSGHTHNRLYHAVTENGTVIMQSGSQGSFIGRLDVQVESNKITGFKHELVNIDSSIVPDPEIEHMVKDILKPHREMLSSIAGYTRTALNRSRIMETTMDNLLLQAIKETAGTELAFSNGWRYGAPVIPGPVTLNDLWNIVPTNPPVSTCQITGAEIREMMEENLEHVFSRDPYNQMGGYIKRCRGLNIYFKVENPAGKRIEDFFIGRERLNDSRTYNACFLGMQGIPERYSSNRSNMDVRAIDSLMQYLAKHNPASSELTGAIVPI